MLFPPYFHTGFVTRQYKYDHGQDMSFLLILPQDL
jgi:hypothetical protein